MPRRRGGKAVSVRASPSLSDLPNEILMHVLEFISCIEGTATLSLVDRRWRALINSERATGRWACSGPATDRSRLDAAAAAAGHIRCLEYLGIGAGIGARDAANEAAANGRLDVLRWMNRVSCAWRSAQVVASAAAGGHLDCLDYALANGCAVSIEALVGAARNGHVQAMHRIYAVGDSRRDGRDRSSSRVQVAAAASGHLDCLECAFSYESARDPCVALVATKGGQLDCLAYAFQSGCVLTKHVTNAAAKRGHLACLAFAHANGCLCNIYTVDLAARRGHAECLDYLLGTAKCLSDGHTWVAAVTTGNIACLQTMSAHNAAPSRDTRHAMCLAAIKYGHAHVLSWIIAHLGSVVDERHMAARLGRLGCLRVVAAAGPTSADDDSVAAAAAGGHIACVDFLHAAGFPVDKRACASAARGGHLECLSYLRRTLKCPWDEGACVGAALGGHLDCLTYLHENGCPWAHAMVVAAIRAGRVDCLTYALASGCPHDAYAACVKAIKCNEAPCLDALCEAGAPLDQDLLAKAIRSGDTKLVGVLVRRQCPRGGVTCYEAKDCPRPRMLCFLYKSGFPWGPSRKIVGHTQNSVRAMVAQPPPFVHPSDEWAKKAKRGRAKAKAKRRASDGMMIASIAL
ncbi:Ankyrin repeat domain containing protein [Pandoravirus neocaledonia]|uniref:Ankyrin repeat domain containing protein n=1 Tax=Pandoravirus neocaledonia TaxID=2107708 RepID=A0A2U7UCU6_9VIRU|nr:Ankyrin repeat domain containing protein [Pandoravirus neocaledonia]AVK76288.1 Ankyrin repeat domain containing protein [Pandoravirus neocaledonia]